MLLFKFLYLILYLSLDRSRTSQERLFSLPLLYNMENALALTIHFDYVFS